MRKYQSYIEEKTGEYQKMFKSSISNNEDSRKKPRGRWKRVNKGKRT